MIVHLAVLGTPLLAYRVWSIRKISMDADPWKLTYTGLIILAIISGVSYFTGPEASDWIKQIVDSFPQDQVEDHALWGRIAFVMNVLTGLLGIMGWASILQEEKPDNRISTVLMVLLLINTLVIIYTAHLGGMIRRMDLMSLL